MEDFTFPTVSDSFPATPDSPPLWRLSSGAPASDNDDSIQESALYDRRKSMSSIDRSLKMSKKAFTDSEGEDEDKMDMLWEDLNEELGLSSSGSRSEENTNTDGSSREIAEFGGGCVGQYQALKLSKTGGAAAGKPGVVVIVKFLKKLFLLHNNHRSAARRRSF